VWKFGKANWMLLNKKIMEYDTLLNMERASTVQAAAKILQENIQKGMDECIPKSDQRPTKRRKTWLNPQLVKLHKEKNKAYKKWQGNGLNESRANYKKLVRRIKKEMCLSKKSHFHKTFADCKDTGSFWKALKSFSCKENRKEIPPLESSDGNTVDDNERKAEVLGQQFASVFLPKKPPSTNNQTGKWTDTPTFNVKQTLKNIKRIGNKKATGSDNIPITLIKHCSLVLAPCLTIIAERCLSEGDFPNIWKQGIISPIPKKQMSPKPSDYRPITLLPQLSKIVERQLNEKLREYIDNKLSSNQFGFREKRGTSDALLLHQHHILQGFRRCEERKMAANVVAVYFDIQKAFDTVPHADLVEKITEKYSLPNHFATFINHYLSGRTMKVRVNDKLSSDHQVTSGVPQGSVMGPTLFTAYFNEVAELQLSQPSDLILFADDVVLLHPLLNDTSVDEIQSDINKIFSCVTNLGLCFNASKCQFQVLSLSNRISHLASNVTLMLGNSQIQRVSSYKYLGVEIDSKLQFSQHTQMVTARCKQGIGALNRCLWKWAPRAVLKTAITSIVLPSFLYAIEIWYPPDVTNQTKLERMLKFATRLLLNNYISSTSYDTLLKEIGWLPIYRLVAERRLIGMWKYVNGSRFIPEDVFSLKPEDTNRISQRLRACENLHSLQVKVHQSPKNEIEDKLCASRSRILWNNLAEATVRSKLSAFKASIHSDDVFRILVDRGAVIPFDNV
jgi:hypothetical protein